MTIRMLALLATSLLLAPTLAQAGNARRAATRIMAKDAQSRPGQDTAWPTSTTTRVEQKGRVKHAVWDSGRFLGYVTTMNYHPVTGEETSATHRSFQIRMHKAGQLVLVTPPRLLRTSFTSDHASREYSVNPTLLRE